MKKIIFTIIFALLLIGALFSQEITTRFSLATEAYFPKYPKYDYDSPVYSFNSQFDMLNLIQTYGIGGELFYSFSSYHTYIQEKRSYELYLHNFFNNIDEASVFVYGFFAGARRTEIFYEDLKENIDVDVMFFRPVIGFKYISEKWGGTLRWTQNEGNHSKLEYELKLRNSIGFIIMFGGSLKGPVQGVDSDFHILAGYEFYL